MEMADPPQRRSRNVRAGARQVLRVVDIDHAEDADRLGDQLVAIFSVEWLSNRRRMWMGRLSIRFSSAECFDSIGDSPNVQRGAAGISILVPATNPHRQRRHPSGMGAVGR